METSNSTNEQNYFLQQMNYAQMGIKIFDINVLQSQELRLKAETPCPVWQTYTQQGKQSNLKEFNVPPEQLYVSSMIIFFLDSSTIPLGLNILTNSFLRCKQYVSPGYLIQQNRILFITENHQDTLKVFRDKLVQRHARTAVWEKVHDKLALYRRKGFQTFMNSLTSVLLDYQRVFALPSSYEEFIVRSIGYDYSSFTASNPMTTGFRKHAVIGNRWGSRIEIMDIARQRLQFNFKIIKNPDPEDWGAIDAESGNWTGLFEMLVNDEADINLVCAFNTKRIKVMNPSQLDFDTDFLTWVTPTPKPVFSYTAFLTPLDNTVWLLTIISTFLFGLAIFYTAKYELRIRQINVAGVWGSLVQTWMWCIGVLLGEYITPIMHCKTDKTIGTRIVLCSWSIGCLILMQSYAGNLKAQMTKPTISKPIESVEAVLNSGIDISILEDGEEEHKMMEASTDPVISQLWKKRKQLPRNLDPVVEGNMIVFNWVMGTGGDIEMHYTNPNTGKQLVYMSPEPVYTKKLIGMAINVMTPWKEQFDQTVQTAIEIGLYTAWRKRILQQKGLNKRARGEAVSRQWKDDPLVKSLELEHFKGVILLYPICVLLVVLVALGECAFGKPRGKV